jgi:hypothetical protein
MLRALILGTLVVVLISIWSPYTLLIVQSSEITWSYFPIAIGTPFALLLLLNLMVKKMRRSLCLRPGELALILVMGLAATGFPIFIMFFLVSMISMPYYFATPENRWEEFVVPYLPEWALPGTEGNAMKWFFEGAPPGVEIPWDMWIGPAIWWLSLIWAVYLVSFCIVVIFRGQWIEHERLTFPVMEMPRQLLEEDRDTILPPLMRDPLFWLGVGIPLLVISWNVVPYFVPSFPRITIQDLNSLYLGQDFPPIFLMILFPVLGFAFFVNLEISFSVWFFYLLAVIQAGIMSRVGLTLHHSDPFVWAWGMELIAWQNWGAFMAMVLSGFWMARRHLKRVLRTAWDRRHSEDDDAEMVSYRTALAGLVLGLLYIVSWLYQSGMELPVILLFLAGVLIGYLGITRIVIETGVYYVTTPVVGQAFTRALVGSALPPQTLVSLGLSGAWFGDVQSIFMPAVAHAAYLSRRISGMGRRTLVTALVLSTVVGSVVSLGFIVHLAYRYGAANFIRGGPGAVAFDVAAHYIQNPIGADWQKLSFVIVGTVVYAILTFVRYRFLWWSLHPIGMVISSVWMVRYIAISFLFAWFCKWAILHYGGVKLYRRIQPVFVGLVFGFFIGVTSSFIVDLIWFPGAGHSIWG